MIRFTFDNDALEHLVLSRDYLSIEPAILESIERNINRIYLSRTNILEMVKGVTPNNLDRLRVILANSHSLWVGGHILLSTEHHLKHLLGRTGHHEQLATFDYALTEIRTLVEADSFARFEKMLGAKRLALQRRNQRIYEAAQRTRRSILARIREGSLVNQDASWFLSPEGSCLFYDLFFPDLLQHLNLSDVLEQLSQEEIKSRLPSLFQYAQAFRSLLYRRIVGQAKARPGDYFDIQKVVYLDLCDYIVSDDKAFRKILDEAGTGDLFGRAICLSKFLQHIDRPFLRNRIISPGHESAEIDRLKRLYE